MAATYTLASTTLAYGIDARTTSIPLTSTSGVYPGQGLFLFDAPGGELVIVNSLGIAPWVNVLRGQGGSAATKHIAGVTAYIGSPELFYASNPVGAPLDAVLVTPWVNVQLGRVFFPYGSPGATWWSEATTTHGQTGLGVRTTTTTGAE